MVISNLLKLIFLMISDNLLLIQATYCVPSIVQVVFIIFLCAEALSVDLTGRQSRITVLWPRKTLF